MALLGACTVAPPTPSPAESSSPGPPTPVASPSGPPAAESPWLQSGTIDQKFTTPALEYRSTGTLLIWSSAAREDPDANTAPDLFGSEPGGEPTLLYDNPNRDSRLELIGGDDRRVVFVEDNARAFGRGAWKMWYLADPTARAALIEEGTGKLPFFGVSGRRLVWSQIRQQSSKSELWLLDLDSMDRRLLQSADAARAQFWFPAIDGHLVVYGKLERSADGQTEQRHVYLIDIDGDQTPKRLDTSTPEDAGASEPAIRGDDVVWKESTLDESHLVGGQLVRHSLLNGESQPLTLDPTGPRYTFPSIGDRYVAGWSGYDRALYLADLKSGVPLRILDLGPTEQEAHDGVGLIAHLRGDLLAYVFGPSQGALELRWIVLGR